MTNLISLITKSDTKQLRSLPLHTYNLNYLIEDNEIVYVGKTINIQSRILTHKRGEFKNFDSFSIIAKLPNEISDLELLKLEEKYIKLLKPKYNIIHNM